MTESGTNWRLGVEPTETTLEWLQSIVGLDERVHIVRRCGGGIGASP